MDGERFPVSLSETQSGKTQESLLLRFKDKVLRRWDALSEDERVYYTNLGIVAAIQAADALTTAAGLTASGGAFAELNPGANSFISQYGMMGFEMAKMGITAGTIATFDIWRRMGDIDKAKLKWPLRIINTLVLTAPLSNATYLLGLR